MGLIYPSKPWAKAISKLKTDKIVLFKGLPGITKTGRKIFYVSEDTIGALHTHVHVQTHSDMKRQGGS